jgi:Arm DNA-binding domain
MGSVHLRKQSASGTAWTLRYRFGGRDRWMALGSYPDMELADARKAARAKRTLVDAGRDPSASTSRSSATPRASLRISFSA